MSTPNTGNTQGVRREQAVFLQSGDPTLERRDPDSYSGGSLGQHFDMPDVPNGGTPATWQLVKTDSVMDVLPYDGAVAWWKDRAAYLVTTDVSVAGRGNRAGIFRDSSAPQDRTEHNIAVSQICCIQKKGVGVAVDFATGTPTAAGLFVVPSATDAKAEAIAAGSPATYPSIGIGTAAVDTPVSGYSLVDVDIDDNI